MSANHPLSQKAFADTLKLNFPLVSDFPDMKTLQSLGVYIADRRLAQRSYFIIDKQGVIRYKQVMQKPGELVPDEVLLDELKKING
jgi:peroxiredoxin